MSALTSTAGRICEAAASLVAGDRNMSHGNTLESHANIAALWNAYLGERLGVGRKITAKDAALMMALLKIARTKTGAHNLDDYTDLAGYAGCAGEIADLMESGE